jgi:branched-chain amino acid aminotransferase
LADEVFLCGTAVELQSVGTVDKYQVGTGQEGLVVARLREKFREVVLGQDSKRLGWCTPVY